MLTKCNTRLNSSQVEYSDEPGSLYYFKYPVAGGGPDDYIPVATTRPETILGDTAVAVHPEDERYKHLVGKEVEVPMGGRCVMVCSGGCRVAPAVVDGGRGHSMG